MRLHPEREHGLNISLTGVKASSRGSKPSFTPDLSGRPRRHKQDYNGLASSPLLSHRMTDHCVSSGMILFMKPSKSGTVNAVSPWAGL